MDAPAAAFYFDLASPHAYLAAERVLHELPGPAEWIPVLAVGLIGDGASDRDGGRASIRLDGDGASTDLDDVGDDELRAVRSERGAADASGRDAAWRAEVERRADELGLQPLRWPEPFPFDSSFAMRAATYAKSIGRTVPFAQAAFRQAFAGGRDLERPDNVLIAAAACEMHPSAVIRGAQLRSVRTQLSGATSDASRKSIKKVPAIVVGDAVYERPDAIERAAARMLELGIGAAR